MKLQKWKMQPVEEVVLWHFSFILFEIYFGPHLSSQVIKLRKETKKEMKQNCNTH